MPQLPSGRHAALRPKNLDKLCEDALSGSAVHQLLAIERIEDLMPYFEIVELIPVELGKSQSDLRPESLQFSGQFEQRSTGITLDRIAALSGLWPVEDCTAFAEFLKEDRVRKNHEWTLNGIKDAQDRLMTEGSALAKMLTIWWRAGVHPAQEEGWDELISPNYSEMEMIVALGVYANVLCVEELNGDQGAWDAAMRLNACWRIIYGLLSDLPTIGFYGSLDVREVASAMRPLNTRDELPQTELTWISAQCKILTQDLLDNVGTARLRAISKGAYEILTLVMMVPEVGESRV